MPGERHYVAETDDLSDEGARAFVEVEGKEIGVFHLDGEFHAILNFCVHEGGPLCDGPLAGRYDTDAESGRMVYEETNRYIQCPWHDWKFDIPTGKNVHSERYAVPTFETAVEDGSVYVVV